MASAEFIAIESAALFEKGVEKAVSLLRAGEVVAVPTETVYGLAANALDPTAVGRIFKIKGRPATNPVIVHVANLEMARQCASEWPSSAVTLAQAFWPGPLTLVLKKPAHIPEIVTAGGSTVALRWPSHAFMQELIKRAGFPLAAPSANLSGQISPTTAEHVRQSLGDRVPLIIDAGAAQVGIESTVVDCTGTSVRVLRPGIISSEQIAAALGVSKLENGQTPSGALRSPGLLEKHYAPRARVIVFGWDSEERLLAELDKRNISATDAHIVAHSNVPVSGKFAHVSVIPLDAEAYARALYAEFHQRDAEQAKIIIIEPLPATAEWEAINDRLRRASA